MTARDFKKLDLAVSAEAVAKAPKPFIEFFERGDVLLELFAPRGPDTQGPHDRDEIYIIASGGGTFRRGEETMTFQAGDALFVPAHVPHRFESFSADFKTWVIFFGSKVSKL